MNTDVDNNVDGEDEAVTATSTINPINDVNACGKLDPKKVCKAVCKISWKTPCGIKYGTGFLCKFKCLNGETFEGLFTCCHVVNCLEDFVLDFESVPFCLPIAASEVKWIYTSRELDVTFMVFIGAMDAILKLKTTFLEVDTSKTPLLSTHVTIPQHPDGKSLSVSEGNVSECKNNKIHYSASTRGGSSGAAVLNDKAEVVAIHQQGGPMNELTSGQLYAKYNIGTLISMVIETMTAARPWDANVWKPCGDDMKSSLTKIGDQHSAGNSLCHLIIVNGNETHCGNAFMCGVAVNNGVTVYGLFTNKHVLICKPDPLLSITLHFANDNSKMTIQPSDMVWFYVDSKSHFTFVEFSATFANEMRRQNRKFLSLAQVKPQCGSKFVFIQHLNESGLMVFQGVSDENFNNSLCIEGTDQSRIHGSLVLNDKSEVIAIGNTCGSSRLIGTLITQDILGDNFKETYKNKANSECTLIKDVTNLSLSKSAAAVCKITTNMATFTGFLCCVSCPNNTVLKGLLTIFDGINQRQSFDIHFDEGNINLKIELSHIRDFYFDKALEFTFIPFKDDYLKDLTSKRLQFLSFNDQQLSDSLPILVLHHPEGKPLSLSRGILKLNEETELHHISNTSFGSAGAPILNIKQQVIGVHKGTGPIDEIGQPLYKTGIRIQDVVQSIRKMKMSRTA